MVALIAHVTGSYEKPAFHLSPQSPKATAAIARDHVDRVQYEEAIRVIEVHGRSLFNVEELSDTLRAKLPLRVVDVLLDAYEALGCEMEYITLGHLLLREAIRAFAARRTRRDGLGVGTDAQAEEDGAGQGE